MLISIEKRYATEITEFFCEEYSRMYKSNRHLVCSMVEKQLRARLIDTGLITEYMVNVHEFDKSEIRDININEILDEEVCVKDYISISLGFKDSTIITIKTK